MVERVVWDHEAAGSKPVTRTMQSVLIGSEYPVMDTLLFYFLKSSYSLNSRKINQRIFFLMIMFKIIFVLWHAQNFLTTCRMRCMC